MSPKSLEKYACLPTRLVPSAYMILYINYAYPPAQEAPPQRRRSPEPPSLRFKISFNIFFRLKEISDLITFFPIGKNVFLCASEVFRICLSLMHSQNLAKHKLIIQYELQKYSDFA